MAFKESDRQYCSCVCQPVNWRHRPILHGKYQHLVTYYGGYPEPVCWRSMAAVIRHHNTSTKSIRITTCCYWESNPDQWVVVWVELGSNGTEMVVAYFKVIPGPNVSLHTLLTVRDVSLYQNVAVPLPNWQHFHQVTNCHVVLFDNRPVCTVSFVWCVCCSVWVWNLVGHVAGGT
jgi:hypothetical protein